MAEERNLTANFTASASGFAGGANQVIAKLNELNTALEQNKQKIKAANDEIKKNQKELNQLRAATNNETTATEEQRRRMQELRDSIAQNSTNLGTFRTAQQRIQSEIRSTNSTLDQQRQGLQSVSAAAKDMGSVLKANLLSSAVQTALRETLQLLKTTATYCYNVGSSFESGMSRVSAISGATASELSQLTAKAKEVGSSTKFTATEAADALNYMAMAGWKTEQMLDGIDGVISLAAASGEDLATTSDIVTDALTAFGLSAEDSAHFADVLAAASSNSNTNVAMMGETFSYCAPIAGAMGYSIEDVATSIGVMANSGIKASQAGTALRTMMTNLNGDLHITGENIGDVEIATTNADGSMKEWSTIVGELKTVFANLTESEKTSTAETLAGKYAMSGFLSLMNAGEADVNKLATAIENCDGATAGMADTMQNNLAGKVTIMKSALEGLGIEMYDKFGNGLNTIVGNLTDAITYLTDAVSGGALDGSIDNLVKSFTRLSDEVIAFAKDALPDFFNGMADVLNTLMSFKDEIGAGISALVAYKAALGISNIVTAAVRVVNSLKNALAGATVAQEELNAAAAVNPYALIAAAISAVVFLSTELKNKIDSCTKSLSELNDAVKQAVNETDDLIAASQGLNDVADQYDKIYKSVKSDADKTAELEKLQQNLIDQYGDQAAGIDLVNGKYEEQIGLMETLIGKNGEIALISAERALNDAEAAQMAGSLIEGSSSTSNDATIKVNEVAAFKWASANLTSFNSAGSSVVGLTKIKLNGTYDDQIKDLTDFYNFLKSVGMDKSELAQNVYNQLLAVQTGQNVLSRAQTNYNRLTTNDVTETAPAGSQGSYLAQMYEEQGKAENERRKAQELAKQKAKLSLEEREKEFEAEKKALKYKLDMDIITEQEYYNSLATLRDTYLDENTDAWNSANVDIHKYEVAAQKAVTSALADAAADDAKAVKAALSDMEKAYKQTLSAIDAEIAAHNRTEEDEDMQKKIDAVTAKLKYANLDEFSRRELENQLADLNKERDELQYNRDMEDKKALAETTYTAAKEAYENSAADLDAALAVASQVFSAISGGADMVSNTVSNTTNLGGVNVILNAISKSTSQIADEVIKAISSSI